MSCNFDQQGKKTARVRTLFVAALVLACAFGTVNNASAQNLTPPQTPAEITVPEGNSLYLVGHAFGSQGYTCLPTSTGGTAWNPGARPEATLFSDLFGKQFHHHLLPEHQRGPEASPRSAGTRHGRLLDGSGVCRRPLNRPDPSIAVAQTGSIQCSSCSP
jgi:hypothetical protein